MSISPTQINQSLSNSNLQSNPNPSTYGPRQHQLSNHDPLQVYSGSESSVAEATSSSGGSSTNKVNEVREPNTRRSSHHRSRGTSYSQHNSAGPQGGLSKFSGEQSGATSSPHNQPNSGSFASNSNSVRRNQVMNANHLLNFQYDRIARPPPRVHPVRNYRKPIKNRPYNKDLFLQANFKFVVLGSGNNAVESTDPDKMLQWENVVCVKYSTPFPVQCPICLESPLCPQITSCGHIFCFPCILQHLLMDMTNDKVDSWKKCPLCFMMISQKDLYTIYIENVKHYTVGDTVHFTLLSRSKDSMITSQKNQQVDDIVSDNVDECDPFSKFSITTDVDHSVRKALVELNDWIAKADAGLVDNMEQLPYVCTALEQLELRKKCWSETHDFSSSPPSIGCKESRSSGSVNSHKLDWSPSADLLPMMLKDERKSLSTSYEKEKYLQETGAEHMKDDDSYSFYQAVDGQHLILHPLNMKCLLHYYGSYDLLPPRISGEVLQLETITQSEAMRRRYRYLSHFSLTTTFQLCEIDLRKFLPSQSLSPFIDEIKKRGNQRKQLARKEHQEKVKAEAAAMHALLSPSNYVFSSYAGSNNDNTFSIDDFEALGNAPLASTSPPVHNERKLFSNVTRLGYAAAHDSPSLRVEESASIPRNAEDRGGPSETGQRNIVTLSFANMLSLSKSPESAEVTKANGIPGKKGKKPSRVLLSTAGGRHY